MLHLGDSFEILKTLPENSVDALVTDPPAGINFMSKGWDSDKGGRKEWIQWMTSIMNECFRVMKPGAHGLVWALPRTSHWTATALEDAGFEVRDVITHLFGQGFPKSLDISKSIDKQAGAEREVLGPKTSPDGVDYSKRRPAQNEKQWQGWGTALKPANEHWILVRKPISEKTVAANVLKWGTGGLNIDSCRIEAKDQAALDAAVKRMTGNAVTNANAKNFLVGQKEVRPNSNQGRFPSNLVLSHSPYCSDDQCDIECVIKSLDEQSGTLKSGARNGVKKPHNDFGTFQYREHDTGQTFERSVGGASRFFYCAKISPSERNAGCDRLLQWDGVDLKQQTESLSLLARVTFADISVEESKWSTDLYGHSISEQYPTGMMFTISTAIKLITELRTLSSSQDLSTKENILGAIRTIEESGLSLAESVAFLSRLERTTIRAQAAAVLNVVSVLLGELSKVKELARTGNFHATVKPQKLMRYLCCLVTPPNGVILDPFMGSGSTGLAALREGFEFIGIEKEPEYFEIAKTRIV